MHRLSKLLIAPPRKQPFPHQSEALKSIVRGFLTERRLTTVMACGTGKTLVALWAAERLQARRILVLVPSLALIQQTLEEWRLEASWKDSDYLCVCSDQTVATSEDALTFEASDIACQVTTKAGDVAAFLRAWRSEVKVVLSTYQSAAVVARGARNLPLFDLGVFDEAHKTAGRQGKAFAFALDDRNLSIRRRIFMTATPRHYRPMGGKDGEQLAYSMDDSKVYGPVVYKLPFGEAAKRRIICPYKVIVCEVTRQEIDQELIRSSEVMVDGFAVSALHVAGQIALKKAMGKFGASKAITFHESVASAERFTREGSWGVKSHLPDYEAFHVNGLIKASERARILTAFTRSRKAIVSNARCLTEGVDIPAVDMVGFFCPKRSVIEVTQATGRAMRRSPGKRTGYILLPVIVDYGKVGSVEEAIGQADYGHIWEVLQALKEQDEALADILIKLRRRKGRKGRLSVPDPTFGGRVEVVGHRLSLKKLRLSIAARCVDLLTSSWEEMLERIKLYRARHGHLSFTKRDPLLSRWAVSQRVMRKHGLLEADRERRLSDLGFPWDPYDEEWNRRYAEVRKHIKNGRMIAPGVLKFWLKHQRRLNAHGKLSVERSQLLAALHLSPPRQSWEQSSSKLIAFRRTHGHVCVGREDGILYSWLRRQIIRMKSGTLDRFKRRRLERLGVTVQSYRDAHWHQLYARLKEFKKSHGHCNVTPSVEKSELIQWVRAQRATMRAGAMLPERKKLLDALGFEWVRDMRSWVRRKTRKSSGR